jgi:probable addiction module antidote protein
MKKFNSFHNYIVKSMRDPEHAIAYLNAAIEEGDKATLLLALRDVAEAQGGIAKIARKAKLDRVSLYRIFSKNGNPEFESLERILKAMGMQLAVTRKKKEKFKKAA